MGILLAVPILFALTLSQWLGTPTERLSQDEAFAKLGLGAVATESLSSLAYGELFFVRLQPKEEGRATFLRSLSGFDVSRGKSEKPIALELERDWWSPPKRDEGTYWKRGDVTIWNPDSEPEIFYAVALAPKR